VARTVWEALQPYALGVGSYVNAETEIVRERVRASHGSEKYARLAAIKAELDPDNVFHQNIPPARPPRPRSPASVG
jgi:FAD/FMN-containing dehydrogenase